MERKGPCLFVTSLNSKGQSPSAFFPLGKGSGHASRFLAQAQTAVWLNNALCASGMRLQTRCPCSFCSTHSKVSSYHVPHFMPERVVEGNKTVVPNVSFDSSLNFLLLQPRHLHKETNKTGSVSSESFSFVKVFT